MLRCVLLIACSSTALEFTVPARDGYKLSLITSKTTKTDDAVLLLHGRTWSSGPVWQTTVIIEWVDPKDGAIKVFNHNKCGPAPQEPYEESLFQRALLRVGTITDRWALPNHATRIFYTVRLDARGNLTAD